MVDENAEITLKTEIEKTTLKFQIKYVYIKFYEIYVANILIKPCPCILEHMLGNPQQ